MTEKVYLAGPFGFTASGNRYMEREVLPALVAADYEVLNPWEAGSALLGPVLNRSNRRKSDVIRTCTKVGAANEQMIRSAATVLALLDGCDLDSGTCAEIGFAYALGIPIFGLRTDTRSAGDVPEISINLQVKYFVEASGGTIESSLEGCMAALKSHTPTNAAVPSSTVRPESSS